jgi:hypothetical protein
MNLDSSGGDQNTQVGRPASEENRVLKQKKIREPKQETRK